MPAPLRSVILAAAGSPRVRTVVTRAPVSRSVVRRFVAGEGIDDAVAAVRALAADGLLASLDHLGEDTAEPAQAEAAVQAYLTLLDRLVAEDLAASAEVSVKLTAVGLDIDRGLAVRNVERIVAAAEAAGTTATLDMEGSDRTTTTLDVLRELRAEHPMTGAVVQAMLRRTEADCRALAGPGSRVRLCKGAYAEPVTVAYAGGGEVSASYRRCLEVLLRGAGYPMVATHDPALVERALALAAEVGREPGTWELQMLFGVRPDEQRRLVAAGHRVRVYVPYGGQWFGYLMRRLAERPANLVFFARALATRT